MKNEVNRYTLNLTVDGMTIPFGTTTLENIDRLTTNFEDEDQFVSYINMYLKRSTPVSEISITYKIYEKTMYEQILFKRYRGIVDDKNLLNKLAIYLSNYSKLKGINLDELNNSFLVGKIRSLLSINDLKKFNFAIARFKDSVLAKEYKLQRNIALYLENNGKEILSHNNETFNEKEVLSCLLKIGSDQQTQISHPKKPGTGDMGEPKINAGETGDDVLDDLIKRRDRETITRLYDLDDLRSLNTGIFDGNHDIDEKNGRNR